MSLPKIDHIFIDFSKKLIVFTKWAVWLAERLHRLRITAKTSIVYVKCTFRLLNNFKISNNHIAVGW